MLYAVRANKRLAITNDERRTYLALGYDIGEVHNGKLRIIQHAPNKKISYAQYQKLIDENNALKAKLENSGNDDELKAKLAAAEKKVKELEKQLKEATKPDGDKK